MNRREFIKIIAAGAAGGLSSRAFSMDSALKSDSGPRPPANRPNIVLVMVDDMGFSDIGCYGGEINTPNLDRLAAGGLRFTQFYNSARCCPTRASLLTGLYPHHAGVGHMVDNKGYPSYQGYLNDRCVTIAEGLKPAGYRTLMSGKWHVGESRPHWPVDRGFDRYYGLVSGGANYFDISQDKAPSVKRTMAIDGESYVPPKENFYITDAFTDNAVKFIDQYGRAKEPFFLYLAYTAPHWRCTPCPKTLPDIRANISKAGTS
jgi:arylsulfatase